MESFFPITWSTKERKEGKKGPFSLLYYSSFLFLSRMKFFEGGKMWTSTTLHLLFPSIEDKNIREGK